MNGFDAPNTFAGLASMCSLTADNEKDNKYSRRMQEMLESSEADEDSCGGAGGAEKKRRLSLHQVRALEMNFEMENKLEPERKNKLAEELGLQPRQVAVWFQNRRARCKTKKLERDNALLRATNDKLERQVEALEAELRELKGRKVGAEENSESEQSIVTTETVALPLETEKDAAEQSGAGGGSRYHHRQLAQSGDVLGYSCRFESGPSSDSDHPCGLMMKQENNVGAYQQLLMISSPSPPPGTGTGTGTGTAGAAGSCSSSSSSSTVGSNGSDSLAANPPPASWFGSQFVRMEEQEQGFYNSEESCNFFSVDQAPTLHWY